MHHTAGLEPQKTICCKISLGICLGRDKIITEGYAVASKAYVMAQVRCKSSQDHSNSDTGSLSRWGRVQP